MTFYLGTHEPSWLARPEFAAVPLFVSARRLRRLKRLPRAGPAGWALDSGGFSEISLYGRWQTSPEQYAREVRRWHDEVGGLAFAACHQSSFSAPCPAIAPRSIWRRADGLAMTKLVSESAGCCPGRSR